jgi:molybdate transport system regulatory protein
MKTTSDRLSFALGSDIVDKRIAILRSVGECGSISEAARHNRVSYKAAWQAVETLSNLAGAALVQSAVGGSGGGGAVLTPAGQRLLQAAHWLQNARRTALGRISREGDAMASLGLQVRTSMRNQWPAQVRRLRRQGGMVRVSLELDQGVPLVALITPESAELLGLVPGVRVLALCKATALEILPLSPQPSGDSLGGPSNRARMAHLEAEEAVTLWQGRVVRASRAIAGGEVALQLGEIDASLGLRAVGFAPPNHGLKVGGVAAARVAHSAVVLVALDA